MQKRKARFIQGDRLEDGAELAMTVELSVTILYTRGAQPGRAKLSSGRGRPVTIPRQSRGP